MLVGSLIIGGSIVYFTRKLSSYTRYSEKLAQKRAGEIATAEAAAKLWEKDRPRRAAPGDRGIRDLVSVLDRDVSQGRPRTEGFDPNLVV